MPVTLPATVTKRKRYRGLALQGLLLAGVTLLAPPSLLWAETLGPQAPWRITADRISKFSDPDGIVAEGNVVLVREGRGLAPGGPGSGGLLEIRGDWVRFDPENNMVKVRGNASLDSEEEHITADSAHLDLEKETGSLSMATIRFPKRNLLLAGEEVEKTGELTYHLEDGWATKCETGEDDAPPWSFAWSKADLTAGGFANLRHVTFRVKDVPLAYSPLVAFSTNQERKTGFLLPEFSHSGRDGAGVLVPLFLDLSPSHDLTLYAGGLSERGVQTGAEFRYVTGYNSHGMVALNYLSDHKHETLEDEYKDDGVLRTNEDRYWLRAKADHDFGGDLVGRLDLDLVSDQDYLQEFQDGLLGFEESDQRFTDAFSRGFDSETTETRSNTVQLSKTWASMQLSAELRTVNDPSDTPSDSYLWSLPMVVFSGRRQLFDHSGEFSSPTAFFQDTDLTWDSEFVYYWQDEGVGAQRIDLHPRLETPLRLSPYLETTASAGLRETLYLVDDNTIYESGSSSPYDNDFLDRTLYDLNLTTSTIFMRDFQVNLRAMNGLTHMIRPELSYDYIPYENQDDLPDMDDVDRIDAANSVTYTLYNDFDLFNSGSGNRTTKKYAYLNLSQSFDIREQRRDLEDGDEDRQPFSAITFEAGFYPIDSLALLYESDLDVHGNGFSRYEFLTGYSTPQGDDYFLEYRYETENEVNQLNASMLIGLSERLALRGDALHSFETDKTTEASLGLLYTPECWSVEFLATTTADDDYRVGMIFSLEGIGKVLGLRQTLYNMESGGLSFKRD